MSSTSTPVSNDSSTSKATITWVVDNFATTPFEWSPPFGFPNNEKIAFILNLQPNVKLFNHKMALVHLLLDSCDKTELPVRYRLSILDAKKQKCREREYQFTLSPNGLSQRYQYYQVPRDLLLNPDNGLLVNEKVTFYCEVEMVEEVNPANEEASCVKTCQDNGAFLDSGDHTDVVDDI